MPCKLSQSLQLKEFRMSITLKAIGRVHSSRSEVLDDYWDEEECFIELCEDFDEEALYGLGDFSHAEVIFFVDQVSPDKIVKTASHPRGRKDWPKIGIFAQRGKNRPNQIGLTICKIKKIEGKRLYLRGLDAVHGSQILDIKPWVEEFGPRGPHAQPEWISELMKNYWS